MATINLKDFYYWYTRDQFIEVSDEVAEVFLADTRHEMAYQRRLSRHKAQYSLDCDDGIEYSACLHEPTPQELLERISLSVCGTRLTLCPKPRAAVWMPVSFLARPILKWPKRKAFTKARCGGLWSVVWRT